MHHDYFWNLLGKKLSGEASEEEINELAELIKANPELCYSAQNIADLWKIKPFANKQVSEKAYNQLLSAIESGAESSQEYIDVHLEQRPQRKKRLAATFALLLMVVVSAAVIMYNQPKPAILADNKVLQEVSTRPGTRTKLLLPDSSVVWLNAGSKLTYAQPFGLTDRKVTLTGEAFFDVVKNRKPFIIYTHGAQIKVLGTAFNVRSYPTEKKIETSLLRGRVEITMDKDPENKYVLNPDEKLTLNTNQPVDRKTEQKVQEIIAVKSSLNHIDEETIAETSWVENKLVFDNESFEEVVRRMERWYGVKIDIKSESLKHERFTVTFEKETVWQALEAIKLSTPFQYQSLKNDFIVITK